MDGRRHGLSDPPLSARALDPRKPYKPLDVGNGIVSGTLTPGGRWLSLGLARAEYTQLTAGGALPDGHSHNRISMHQRSDWPDSLFLVEDRSLGAAATIAATYAEIGAGSEATAILVVALGLEPMATMTEA